MMAACRCLIWKGSLGPPGADAPAALTLDTQRRVSGSVISTYRASLGRSRRAPMEVGELLKLGPGAVLELDRRVGEAIDIYVNNRLVARGEVVLVEDKLGVTMTEIIKADRN